MVQQVLTQTADKILAFLADHKVGEPFLIAKALNLEKTAVGATLKSLANEGKIRLSIPRYRPRYRPTYRQNYRSNYRPRYCPQFKARFRQLFASRWDALIERRRQQRRTYTQDELRILKSRVSKRTSGCGRR